MPEWPASIECLVDIPEAFDSEDFRHVPDAMIAETLPWVARPLCRKAMRQFARRKSQALLFKPGTMRTADEQVFRFIRNEPFGLAGLHELQAAQRKSSIPNIMAIVELWPTRTDIVVVQKNRIPATSIQDVAIPLCHEAMGSCNVIGQLLQHELRIGPGRGKPFNPHDAYCGVPRTYVCVSEQNAGSEIAMLQACLKRAYRCLHVH